MSERAIEPGYYKGRAVAGSEQYGHTSNGTEQIAVDIDAPTFNRRFTTFLYFSDAAAPYAIEKLRACGWTGSDLGNLYGIDANEIDFSVKYEVFEGKERMKVDIATGGGRITLEKPMSEKDKRAFAARMKPYLAGGNTAKNAGLAPPVRRGRKSPEPDFDPDAGARGDDEIPF
jgi:hypothetical protein